MGDRMGVRRSKILSYMMSRDLPPTSRRSKIKQRGSKPRPSSNPLPGPSRTDLISALMLRYDPFEHRVTEQEIGQSFAEIYVEPVKSLLVRLQEPHNSFVFAAHGQGKSATRLALEYTLRLSPDISSPTLCVRYEPDYAASVTKEYHLRAVQKSIATDLIIQTFERYTLGLITLDDAMTAALRRQAAILPAQLRPSRLLAFKEKPPQDGVFWGTIRPTVEPLSISARWHELMDIIATTERQSNVEHQSWNATLQDVRTLGFENIYVLVDAIDEKRIEPLDWLAFLAPILNVLPELQDRKVFLKGFFPIGAEKRFRECYEQLFGLLTPPPEFTTIALTSSDLKQILERRTQAAKQQPSRVVSLDLLAGPGIDESIEAWLVEAAHSSPRQLIKRVSQLLDFHTEYGFQDNRRLHLTREEWLAFKALIHNGNDGP